MSESTRAKPKPEAAAKASTAPAASTASQSMPGIGPLLAGALPPSGGGRRRLLGDVQRRAGNRSTNALLARRHAPDSIEAMWHEASRTGSRAAATRVAKRAVAGARPGGLLHAEHIRSASKGKVDVGRIPATVVDGLPALGVCYDGKIAVRRGAPKSIVAHEVAHAMGADEATAHRVERDPTLLGGLTPKAPVNGWAIGFEFQCTGENDPKVYKEEIELDPLQRPGRDRHVWKLNSGSRVLSEHDGYKLEADSADLEVVTDPFPETEEGAQEMLRTMARIETHMKDLRTEKTQLQKPDEYALKFKPIFVARWDWVTKVGGSTVIASRDSNFAGSPQATAGFTPKALSNFMTDVLSEEKRKNEYIGWGSRRTRAAYEGVDDHQVWAAVEWARQVVESALDDFDEIEVSTAGGLLALVKLLAAYVANGRMLGDDTANLKNIAPFMLRNSVLDLYGLLSEKEKEVFGSLQAKTKVGLGEDYRKSMAYALSYGSNAKYRAASFAPHGVSAPDDGWTGVDPNTLTVTQIVDGIIAGRDYIREATDSVGIHKLKLGDMGGDVESTTDIGGDRSGILVELRRLPKRVPYPKWRDLAWWVFQTVKWHNDHA